MLSIHPDRFFAAVRPLFRGHFSTLQVESLNALLAAGASLTNLESLAYLLATAYHETGHTMLPVAEYGKGAGRDYGRMLDMGMGPGRRVAYTTPAQLYYGRGYVQLTWRGNYATMGRVLGLDLLAHPELALVPEHAVRIALHGMVHGSFTGKKLSDYFPSATGLMAPIAARRIINGQDCAELIAGYYSTFLTALRA